MFFDDLWVLGMWSFTLEKRDDAVDPFCNDVVHGACFDCANDRMEMAGFRVYLDLSDVLLHSGSIKAGNLEASAVLDESDLAKNGARRLGHAGLVSSGSVLASAGSFGLDLWFP